MQGDRIRLAISDAGIDAFENLRSRLGLEDHLHALQELSKPTTQPEQHFGEGLFFTSKAVARPRLTANGLSWIVDNELEDQTVAGAEPAAGTRLEPEGMNREVEFMVRRGLGAGEGRTGRSSRGLRALS